MWHIHNFITKNNWGRPPITPLCSARVLQMLSPADSPRMLISFTINWNWIEHQFLLRYTQSLLGPLMLYTGLSFEYRKYKHILAQHELDAKWDNFKRWSGERNRLQQDETLHVYVQGNTGKIDVCLRISQPLLRSQALAWLINKAFSSQNCRVCSNPFNRGHLKHCGLSPMPWWLSTLPAMLYFLNVNNLARFQVCWDHLDRCTVIHSVATDLWV
jgi:hypothetical protein